MNFGKWIVVAFVLFAAFIGTLVTVCVNQDVNLVSKTYYKDELAYQDQIVRISNTQQLVDKPVIAKTEKGLEIKFQADANISKGEMKLFCPSNPEMDRSYSLALDGSNKQAFDISTLKSGMYKAKLLWTMEGKEYFVEEVIYL
jgi:hypothetical protein